MGYPTGPRRVVFISVLEPTVEQAIEALAEDGFLVERRHDLAGVGDTLVLARALTGAWAVIAGTERYDRNVFDRAKTLRVIARPGAGYDRIDVASATEAGVLVFTTPAANAQTVADFTLGLILAATRGIVATDSAVRAGSWPNRQMTRDLHGTTVGILGLGAIGKAVAHRLSAFDCTLLATEPHPDLAFCREHSILLVDLEDLMTHASVLTVHVPLTPATRHLIGAELLAKMRADAIIVNSSRGAVIDEPALIAALRSGAIAGAALDVFEDEPLLASSPLRDMSNVVLTSHVAARTDGAMRNMVEAIVAGLRAAARGDVPAHSLNPEVMNTWQVR